MVVICLTLRVSPKSNIASTRISLSCAPFSKQEFKHKPVVFYHKILKAFKLQRMTQNIMCNFLHKISKPVKKDRIS